jgi:hypothetical protein
MAELALALPPNIERPSKRLLLNTALFAVVVIPAITISGLMEKTGTEASLPIGTSVFLLVSVCLLATLVVRRWSRGLFAPILIASYPLLGFVHWQVIGRTIPFGDDDALRPMIDWATYCWQQPEISGLCFLQGAYDSRYVASSVYHGYRIALYGDSPVATVSWGCAVLLSAAILLLPGLFLSGLTRAQALGTAVGLLLWPDFIDMTGWLGRDLIILWGLVAWYSGIRIAVNLSAKSGALLAFVGIVFLAFTRPVYLLICALDYFGMVNLEMFNGKGKTRIVVLVLIVILLCVGILAWLNNPVLGFIQDTTLSQADVASHGLGTTSSSNIGGKLSALTGAGYFVSIPIRILISAVAPFPWTSPQIFGDDLGGFNGNWSALVVHILKSIASVAGLLLLPTLLLKSFRRSGFREMIRNSNLALCGGLLISAGIADTGYSRYIAMSYPFLAGSLFHLGTTTHETNRLSSLFGKAMFIAIAGTVLVLLIYEFSR